MNAISSGAYSSTTLYVPTSGSGASAAQMKENLFGKMDADGNGSIERSELSSFIDQVSSQTGATASSSSDDVFATLDGDGDGSISAAELEDNGAQLFDQLRQQLMNTMLETMRGLSQQDSDDMFSKIDTNQDGSIDKAELTTFSELRAPDGGTAFKAPSVDDIFASDDSDGDGTISKDEFQAAMSRLDSAGSSATSTGDDQVSALIAAVLRMYDNAQGASSPGSQLSALA